MLFKWTIYWVIVLWIWVGSNEQVEAANNIEIFPLVNKLDSTLESKEKEPVTSVANLENFYPGSPSPIAPLSVQLPNKLEQPILIAAPENFNPELRFAPPSPPEIIKPSPVVTPQESITPVLILESMQTDFRRDLDNFQQHNQIIEPTFQFRLPNNQIIRLRTGFNTFERLGIETVTNIPFQIGWEGKIGKYTVQAAGGVDLFNRLPAALNFRAQVDRPVFINLDKKYQLESGLFTSVIVERGPYKANAQTLENEISAWRLGPNVYWQIDRNTSFFSLYRWGLFNDGNYEQQSFTRLERKLGSFFVAANFFTWRFESDRQESGGYFSPPDFLVYNGEIGWEGDIFEFLRCRVNTTLGRQRLRGDISGGNSYQARCTVKFSDNAELDLGYGFSNVRNLDTGDSPYNNRSLTGQLRIKL